MEFKQYMESIGTMKHPNIARLRAYYYAGEEKLLVYNYMSSGSLHSLLHGLKTSMLQLITVGYGGRGAIGIH